MDDRRMRRIFGAARTRARPVAPDEKALALVRGTGGASVAGASAFRTWTDSTGSFRIEAEFLGVADGKVKLRRKDSREIAVPLERLSAADKQEVERLQQPAAPSNPFAP
jgi:hypothetical protein